MLTRTKNFNKTPLVNIGRNQQMSISNIAHIVNNINELLSEKTIMQISVRKNSELIVELNEPIEFYSTLDDIGFFKEDGSIAISFPVKSLQALYFWRDCFEHSQILNVNMRDGTRYTLNLWLGQA